MAGVLKKRRFLPVAIDVTGKRCLVVGGGSVGTRKALTLARAGARVTVVAPAVETELERAARDGQIGWVQGPFEPGQLADAFLVVAATDQESLNAEVVHVAAERGVLSCDASSAERSQLIFGALLERPDATVAVFTDGRDPAHARRLRDQIGQLLPTEAKGRTRSGDIEQDG